MLLNVFCIERRRKAFMRGKADPPYASKIKEKTCFLANSISELQKDLTERLANQLFFVSTYSIFLPICDVRV